MKIKLSEAINLIERQTGKKVILTEAKSLEFLQQERDEIMKDMENDQDVIDNVENGSSGPVAEYGKKLNAIDNMMAGVEMKIKKLESEAETLIKSKVDTTALKAKIKVYMDGISKGNASNAVMNNLKAVNKDLSEANKKNNDIDKKIEKLMDRAWELKFGSEE